MTDNRMYDYLKREVTEICEQNKINFKDFLVYCIYSEPIIGILDKNNGTIDKCKRDLAEDYEELWDMQPTIEEDENKAFAIQHARDIYDILLDRTDF